MAFSFFRPFGTGNGATVLSPGTYAAQSWVSTGFQPGIADPASVNTVWRQGAFVAAGITQWMANTLNQNINDDGNLNNFVTLFTNSIHNSVGGGVISFNTRTGAVTLTSADVISALGYTPVRSFNGRTGQVVINAADVNTALGYQPIKKSGDTMSGLLSGPDPTQLSHYATKNYVDNSVAIGHSGASNIVGYSTETDFPLPNGGIIKVGTYFPGAGFYVPPSGYLNNGNTPPGNGNGLNPPTDVVLSAGGGPESITGPILNDIDSAFIFFATAFPNACIQVAIQLVYDPPDQNTPFGGVVVSALGGGSSFSGGLHLSGIGPLGQQNTGFLALDWGYWLVGAPVVRINPGPAGLFYTAIGY